MLHHKFNCKAVSDSKIPRNKITVGYGSGSGNIKVYHPKIKVVKIQNTPSRHIN
jgi:hypothetical protein